MLAKPQTFMNLSGTSVAALMEKHELAAADVVAVWDELNLPWGGLKILKKGSAGGHNGAESLIRSLGTQEFVRVRLGIHPGHPLEDGARVFAGAGKALAKEGIGRAGGAGGRRGCFHNLRGRRNGHDEI